MKIDVNTASVSQIIEFLANFVIVYLRHGKAHPAAKGQDDVTRELDETGQEEARQAVDLRKECGLNHALVICSPAERCLQTADARGQVEAVVRYELYCEATGSVEYDEHDFAFFQASYAALGNAPNTKYFEFAGVEGDAPFRRWTDGDGKTGGALRAIAEEIVRANLEPRATVMVVAHGNFGPFLMQRLAEEWFRDSSVITDMQTRQLGTAEAFVVDRGRYVGTLVSARGGMIDRYGHLVQPSRLRACLADHVVTIDYEGSGI